MSDQESQGCTIFFKGEFMYRYISSIRFAILLAVLTLVLSVGNTAGAVDGVCDAGTGIPPFLPPDGDPNLLLIIDNSASMYDLAYVNNSDYCYDGNDDVGGEKYDPTYGYTGYFESDSWYAYEGAQFVTKTDAEAKSLCDVATNRKTVDGTVDGANNICLKATEKTFDSLVAKGNFLNWVAASKLDIEKKVLTGGKYENGKLIMESRGCLERRFIKKTAFDVGGGYFTLAVRPPTSEEEGSATRIELFPVTEKGYNHAACQQAVDEMRTGDPALGTLKGYIDECMGYTPGGNTPETASESAFNHSVQNCWYLAKHGVWEPGEGSVSRIMNDCANVYKAVLPASIEPDHSGYVCFGDYTRPVTDLLSVRGYVGRCWDPVGEGSPLVCVDRVCKNEKATGNPRCDIDGFVYQCDGIYDKKTDTCDTTWVRIKDCTGGGVVGDVGWTNDQCVDQGLRDYCGSIDFPEVVDPSDQVDGSGDATGEFWNLPAMMVDSGVSGQLGQPLAVLVGSIAQDTAPTGLIQENAAYLRIGVMELNRDGAKSECLPEEDPYVTYDCEDPTTRDGGRIITDIDQGTDHTAKLVEDINNIVADTWTPLAEAMYNALGYYRQDSEMRLDGSDFIVGPDPVIDWCQFNNILLITDGTSTADQNRAMEDFVETTYNYVDYEGRTEILHGSTYLADLAYYGQHDIWKDSVVADDNFNQPIKTSVVALRGSAEAVTLMTETAENGGTVPYLADDISQLGTKLGEAFANMRIGASAGSAASVISSSRSGEGAIYQAIFWQKLVRQGTPLGWDQEKTYDFTIEWVGDVHGLFIDDNGFMYEDSNKNRALDLEPDDKRVFVYYDTDQEETRACSEAPILIAGASSCGDSNGGKSLQNIDYLWSANDTLSSLEDVKTNRSETNFISDDSKRYIFTWSDGLNGTKDGIVNSSEVVPFVAANDDTATCGGTSGGLSALCNEFNADSPAVVDDIINWIRGDDSVADYRSRQSIREENDSTVAFTWRLGDIIHSTPQTVAAPAENYHLLYNDASYATFADKYKTRRHMVYFGANDGMLHAVNAGFYSDTLKKFCLSKVNTDGSCPVNDSGPKLGTEMWAYVPYNLHPHLKCLTDPEYEHKYFVDLKPRIFDVQIFTEDPVHPGGWGTILVGGLGFGGAEATSTYNDPNNNTITQPYISSYFIFDITDPEKPPVLLGEMTQEFYAGIYKWADLGYSTVMPTMVVQKNETTNTSNWYLVFGSGPQGDYGLQGVSDQPAKVSVLDLKDMVSNNKAMRISKDLSTGNAYSWTKPLGASNGFVSDMITIDFDINPANNGTYISDAVYFGTVEGNFSDVNTDWNGGGQLFRMVMNGSGHEIGVDNATTPGFWEIKPLLDLSGVGGTPTVPGNPIQPITAAPSVGTDGYNYWIYFGTGRFFDAKDKIDSTQQSFYGIKEPMEITPATSTVDTIKKLTWDTVTVSQSSGSKGLWRADEILVKDSAINDTSISELACSDVNNTCLPSGVTTFTELENYIAGDKLNYGNSSCTEGKNCADGWYINFFPDYENRERNLGQATLLGGLVTFTTYQPSDDLCLGEGNSFLYAPYYKTGTPWHENVFGENGRSGDYVLDKIGLGLGMTTTPSLFVGSGTDAKGKVKAFIQTSTGEIVEITQENLPVKQFATGRDKWKEYQRP
ncbi:pilus assembly protein [Desulfocastanea catecholica]